MCYNENVTEIDNFRIEDAKPEDVEAMRSIVRDAWVALYPNEKYGVTAEDILAIDWYKPEGIERSKKNIIENLDTMRTWVLKDSENKIVGFCKVEKFAHYGEVDSMYVIPEHKGKGLGKKLMDKAFEWLGSEQDIILKVVSYNSRAIEFYKKMGFKETGKDVTYRGTKLPSGIDIPRIEMIKQATLSN